MLGFSLYLLLYGLQASEAKPVVRVPAAEVLARHEEQEAQINRYLDRLVKDSERIRAAAWKRDFSSIPAYEKSIAPWRKRLADWLGGMNYPPAELKPREKKLAETAAFTAYRVWFTAFEDVQVYGILLLPQKKAATRLPVVICIHGMAGSPEAVCGLAEKEDYHRRFGARLAEHGFVVFAPLDINTLKGRSYLDRKAKMVGQRLQGLEQFKIKRVVDYLRQRPEVDGKRIASYGISWGGRTSMNAAALDPRIAACVVSGHFMDSTPKMVTASEHYTAYIQVAEDYAFFERHFLLFSDADICSLICPRPLFIEQGRQDRVAYWKMAKKAFVPVQEYFRKLKVGDRAVFHLFEGEHVVHGDEAIKFLEKQLESKR
jgi:dienelactone hydrolase